MDTGEDRANSHGARVRMLVPDRLDLLRARVGEKPTVRERRNASAVRL